jgi:hypothetical protein
VFSGPVISRVSSVCLVDRSCATAGLPSTATSPHIVIAAVKNTLNRRMHPPMGFVASLLRAPVGGASPPLFVRSALHRLLRVYETPTVILIFSFGPEIGGGPLYESADLGRQEILGGE